jgi:hypothetical protein
MDVRINPPNALGVLARIIEYPANEYPANRLAHEGTFA